MMMKPKNPLYGVMGEFENVDSLLHAADELRMAGLTCLDAFSPFPIEGLSEALGQRRSRLSLAVLLAGIGGFMTGYGFLYFVNVIDYPINVGGRPLHSAPSFIPIAFECTVLFAAMTAALGMLARNGFPRPYHPVFNVDSFKKASTDGFFLCIESDDPKFSVTEAKAQLKKAGAKEINEVPA